MTRQRASEIQGKLKTGQLGLNAVTGAQLSEYVSGERTGTGSEETIAHGLLVIPVVVIATPQAGHNGSGAAGTQAVTITHGTHTSTNLLLTVSSGAKYRVFAM